MERSSLKGGSILDDMPDFQARLGYVPEEPTLISHLSGREYLQLAGRFARHGQAQLEEEDERVPATFFPVGRPHCPSRSYSKGMRQKIMISAALLHNPQVLILDEPLRAWT